MDKTYVISHMSRNEMTTAIAWAKAEGWNPGLNDANCFYNTDPQGFFVGKLGDKIIAIGSAVIYDDHFAFCGFYRVDPSYRDKGYGLALTKARLNYVGSRNVGIDGVIPMLKKYERLGYQLAYNNARYATKQVIKSIKHPALVPVTAISLTDLYAYDRRHFPAPRASFLTCWLNQDKSKAEAFVLDGKLMGYGVIRACYQGFKIGPLFADNADIADVLFRDLASFAQNEPVYLDIPECNPEAIALVKRHQLDKVFATARMYLKEPPKVALESTYGITSFELG